MRSDTFFLLLLRNHYNSDIAMPIKTRVLQFRVRTLFQNPFLPLSFSLISKLPVFFFFNTRLSFLITCTVVETNRRSFKTLN